MMLRSHGNFAECFWVLTVVIFVKSERIEGHSTSVVRSLSDRGESLVDVFSVPSCSAESCRRVFGSAGCAGDDCCTCQCAYDRATFFFNDTAKRCVSNAVLFHKCKFSFTKDAGEPPLVTKNLTSSRGRLKFQQSPDVQCAASGDQVVVSHWLYLLNGGWVSGHGNAFRVETKRVGSLWNTKQLTFLELTEPLDKKYAGLVLQFHLKCSRESALLGCSFIKTEGNHTYRDPALNVSDTTTPTGVTPPHTGGIAPETSPTSSAVATAADEHDDSQTEKREAGKSSNQTLLVAMAATGSMVAVLGLIIMAVFLCRRRLKQRSSDSVHVETLSTATDLQTHEEDTYEEMPTTATVPGQFDNPTYGDSDPPTNQRSRMDPLPPVPGEPESRPEIGPISTYQSLLRQKPDETRSQIPAYDNPVSCSAPGNAHPTESSSCNALEDPRMTIDRNPNSNPYDNANQLRQSDGGKTAENVPQETSNALGNRDEGGAPLEPFYVVLEQPDAQVCDAS